MTLSIELLMMIGIVIVGLVIYYWQKTSSPTSTDVHIVVDNSNIFIGSQYELNKKTGKMETNPAVRLNVEKLVNLVEDREISRDIRTRLVGGSEPPRNARVWKEWENCNYKVVLGDRSAANKEVFLDDMLHCQMFKLILDHQSTKNRRQVLVLLSGDGNTNFGRTSFPEALHTALKHQWHVELWSWKNCFSKKFLELQQNYSSQMKIKYFDSNRKLITFTESPKAKT
ncbi:hypothetical protein I4U23_010629 [Adineta vaga]|nr:hypothetical protein I4U23_010629 [Adineta vaga]